ncbi:hypothetical protein DPMN_067974 [Dreissena polymorpha]|uniref:Uncharacterized protein n=1 Tax=Dreissena polymorpha TaxID=45954 RepID=A0A9D3Z1B7_DREPO|nr:hypothetical protein DPMN_067974 [Dreissena polymorpha]
MSTYSTSRAERKTALQQSSIHPSTSGLNRRPPGPSLPLDSNCFEKKRKAMLFAIKSLNYLMMIISDRRRCYSCFNCCIGGDGGCGDVVLALRSGSCIVSSRSCATLVFVERCLW